MSHNNTRTRLAAILSALLVLLVLAGSAGATPPIGSGLTIEFADSGQSHGSSDSLSVSLGDLDGDGNRDAYVANWGQPNRIYFGDSSGAFTNSSQSLGSGASQGTALGDLDGDGDLDAFVANSFSQPNKVWTNNGSGIFTDSGQSLSNATTLNVVLGDIDGDGDLDALASNNGTSAIWNNDGSGSFTDSGQSLPGSSGASLSDVDGDGDLDAFFAVSGANLVYLNNGSGIFADSGQVLGSSDSYGVALGDVDNDGDLDAFVANGSGQGNRVFTNNSGTFADSGQSLGSSTSRDVSLDDLDGDGDLDAFVVNDSGQANRIWQNDGSGTFSDSGHTLGSSNSWGVALGDVDGDGDTDAFTANNSQANKLWRNDAVHRNAPFADSGQTLASANSKGVRVGDLDGDGDLDAFVANANAGNEVWDNDGTGGFTTTAQSMGTASSQNVGLADVDGDGDLDAFIANYGQANTVWINQGGAQAGTPGTFADSSQTLSTRNSFTVALGDVDGDGDLDAFVGNNGVNKVWLNNGSGTFSATGQNISSERTHGVSLGDVDNDGDLDAFTVNYDAADRVWLNDSSGSFSGNGQSLGSGYGQGAVLGDVDNDGDLDAYVANRVPTNGQFLDKLWINQGGAQGGTLGQFADSGQSLGCGTDAQDAQLQDLDNDGDLDVIVVTDGQNCVRLNDGTGTFGSRTTFSGNIDSEHIAVADLDRDGDLDAFVANAVAPNRVWRNEGGSAGFAVTDTYGGSYIPNGSEDDVLNIDFNHNGIAADRDLELNFWNLDLFRSDCATPLTSSEANAFIDRLRVRLDDGDGTFETDGSDVLVADVGTLSLSSGVQQVTFTDGDANVQIAGTGSAGYWVSILATADADQQDPNNVCVNVDPDADMLVEGKTPDFRVSVQDSTPTDTGDVPTVVSLRTATANATAPATTAGLLTMSLITLAAGLLVVRRRR